MKMYRELLVIAALSTTAFGSILDGDLDIADGVKLVRIPVSNSLEDEGGKVDENSPLFGMPKFPQGYELRVNLANMIEKDKIRKILKKLLKSVDEMYKDSLVTGRGESALSMLFTLMMVPVAIVGMGFEYLKMPFEFIYYVKKYGL